MQRPHQGKFLRVFPSESGSGLTTGSARAAIPGAQQPPACRMAAQGPTGLGAFTFAPRFTQFLTQSAERPRDSGVQAKLLGLMKVEEEESRVPARMRGLELQF